jgi:hypothetical protein
LTTDNEVLKKVAASAVSLNLEVPSLKSLFVEIRFGEIVLGTGTGFLASDDRETHCAFITNRHNVTGRHQETGKCLDRNSAVPDNLNIYFHREPLDLGEWIQVPLPLYTKDGEPTWIEHPRLGAEADVVALNLNWGDDVCKLPYFMELKLDRVGMLVGPAETVSVIGFPFGMSSFGKFPLWATGFLAQELSLITPENPVFLIDCRARPGQSGSAVIAHRLTGYRSVADGKATTTMGTGSIWEFLGIYSGRVNNESDLGRVWHVSVVREVLAAAALKMQLSVEAAAKLTNE